MTRSRSSFDLSSAIAAAASLTTPRGESTEATADDLPPPFEGVALVSFKIVDMVVGLRVTEDQEREGLDTATHGERAYN